MAGEEGGSLHPCVHTNALVYLIRAKPFALVKRDHLFGPGVFARVETGASSNLRRARSPAISLQSPFARVNGQRPMRETWRFIVYSISDSKVSQTSYQPTQRDMLLLGVSTEVAHQIVGQDNEEDRRGIQCDPPSAISKRRSDGARIRDKVRRVWGMSLTADRGSLFRGWHPPR
jgi:hypothetical protein